jgi:squalene-hopene/tetraprenyl-beta-curcumene cyclase
VDGIATQSQREETLSELLALQLDDGGWSTSSLLSDWKGLSRSDGRPLETKTSDGYGTGFAMVVARELGLPADDVRLRHGVGWLQSNQRVSGKWFTQSPVNQCGNLISNVGSAYAILALQACGELPGGAFGQTKR